MIEIEVVSGINECPRINLAIPLSQLDSLRITAYLLFRIARSKHSDKLDKIISRIESGETRLIVTSPFFLESVENTEKSYEYFFPVNFGFFCYYSNRFKNDKGEVPTKELRKVRYFPILNSDYYSYNFVHQTIAKGKGKFEEGPFFRAKNVIDRNGSKSVNVYTVENYFVSPFRFIVLANDSFLESIIKAVLFDEGEIHFLGKRISIGFGRVKFKLDYRFEDELRKKNLKIEEKVEKGVPYYLFNRIPITESIVNSLDLEKSCYEIVKVSGYLVKDDALVGRSIICLREGSILVFKESLDLKNEIYRLSREKNKKEYFLPFLPALIRMVV